MNTNLKIELPPGPDREAEKPRLSMARDRDRRIVYDKRTIPDNCPLRQGNWIAGGT